MEIDPATEEISFRAKGKRTRYSVGLGHVLNLAIQAKSTEEYSERLKAYREARFAGRKVKKPKQPFFNGMYAKILTR